MIKVGGTLGSRLGRDGGRKNHHEMPKVISAVQARRLVLNWGGGVP